MIYAYIYAAIGVAVALWFYLHMRKWSWVGDQMKGGSSGTYRLLALLPAVAALWPVSVFLLLSDRR